MTAIKVLSNFEKLGFEPTVEEQLLLPEVNDHNLLVLYMSEEILGRLISLLTLFYLNQKEINQKSSKILIVTKRSNQQRLHSMLMTNLDRKATILNGSILPNARRSDYNDYSIIIATPKIAKNDLKDQLFSKNHFNFLLIINAEFGSSSSSLRYLVNKMENIRICGFTQHTNMERLKQVCKNLTFSKLIRFEQNSNKGGRTNIQYYSIPLPQEYFSILELLDLIRKHELEELQIYGFDLSTKSTFREVAAIHETLIEEKNMKLLVKTGNLQRIMILQKIIISQGFPAALKYLNDLESKLDTIKKFFGKHAIKEFLNDVKIKKLREYLSFVRGLEHPKSKMLLKLISKHKTGISIVTHNFYNATFLKDLLSNNKISVIRIEEPISRLTEIKLKQSILPFSEGKSQICITNTINETIAKKAKIIIAYDVNADIVERLNNLSIDIPKLFLLSKQTNEEARFFYLRRLGKQIPHKKNLNPNSFDNNLIKMEDMNAIEENDNPVNENQDSSFNAEKKKKKLDTLIIHKSLYEYKIPYIFSPKEFEISMDDNLPLPGLILNDEIYFIFVISETISLLMSSKISVFYQSLVEKYNQVHLLILPNNLKDLSFSFRCELFHEANRYHIWISFLEKDIDIFKLMNHLRGSQLYQNSKL